MSFCLPALAGLSLVTFLSPSCRESVPLSESFPADDSTHLLAPSQIADVVRVELSTQTEHTVLYLDEGDRWLLAGPRPLVAHHPALRSTFLVLANTPRGQQLEHLDEDLIELGLSPDSPNYVKLSLFGSSGKKIKSLIFGDFDQPFDQSATLLFGEKTTARRYLHDPDKNQTYLVAYPFHEIRPEYDYWYIHNLEVVPGRLKTATVTYPDGRQKVIQRQRMFQPFRGAELSPQDQRCLNLFLEEGFFLAIVPEGKEDSLSPLHASVSFTDFNDQHFKLEIGQSRTIEVQDHLKGFQPGIMDISAAHPEEKIPAHACRYTAYLPDQPPYSINVYFDIAELQPFLKP